MNTLNTFPICDIFHTPKTFLATPPLYIIHYLCRETDFASHSKSPRLSFITALSVEGSSAKCTQEKIEWKMSPRFQGNFTIFSHIFLPSCQVPDQITQSSTY